MEVAVILFRRTTDKENWWQVVYELKGLEQACLLHRLGPDMIFDLQHCTLHFILDFTNPTHEEAVKKMVQFAIQQETDLPNFWNVRLMGRRKQVSNDHCLSPVPERRDVAPDCAQCLNLRVWWWQPCAHLY